MKLELTDQQKMIQKMVREFAEKEVAPIAQELDEKSIARTVPKRLFDKVLLDLRKETFYINNLLPLILANKDISLREDFLNNSGLDRFYIETLEKEYFESKDLDRSLLEFLSESSEFTSVGGGERI